MDKHNSGASITTDSNSSNLLPAEGGEGPSCCPALPGAAHGILSPTRLSADWAGEPLTAGAHHDRVPLASRWGSFQKPGNETWSLTQPETRGLSRPLRRHVPVAWPCLISSVVRSMSTYKDQTTQVMAMTWNATEHMTFLRSLAVICSFSHCGDSTQGSDPQAVGEGAGAGCAASPQLRAHPQYPATL